jgi:hypothetical protein
MDLGRIDMATKVSRPAGEPRKRTRKLVAYFILGTAIALSSIGGGALVEVRAASAAPSPEEIANALEHGAVDFGPAARDFIHSLSNSRTLQAFKHLNSEKVKEATDDACKARDVVGFFNMSASGQRNYLKIYFGASPKVAQAADAVAEDLNNDQSSGTLAIIGIQSVCFGVSAP